MYRKVDHAITIQAFEDSLGLHSPWSCISPLVRVGAVIVAFFTIFTYWFWNGWRGGKREASDDKDGQQSERIDTPVHILAIYEISKCLTRAACCKDCMCNRRLVVSIYTVSTGNKLEQFQFIADGEFMICSMIK